MSNPPRIVWSRIRPVPRDSVFDAAELVEDALRAAKQVVPSAYQVQLVHAVRVLAAACRECGLDDVVALVVPEK